MIKKKSIDANLKICQVGVTKSLGIILGNGWANRFEVHKNHPYLFKSWISNETNKLQAAGDGEQCLKSSRAWTCLWQTVGSGLGNDGTCRVPSRVPSEYRQNLSPRSGLQFRGSRWGVGGSKQSGDSCGEEMLEVSYSFHMMPLGVPSGL